MRHVGYADGLPHEGAAAVEIGGRRGGEVLLALGIDQLLDGDGLAQPVQGQDGLHGRDAPRVLLNEGLAIGSRSLVLSGGRHHCQRLSVLELLARL